MEHSESSRLRFVVLTHEFWPFRGGVATYCAEVSRAGVEAGLAVEVWASGHSGDEQEFVFPVRWLEAGVRLHPLDLMGFALALVRRAEELKGCVIVLASVGAQKAWMLASTVYRFPVAGVVTLFHGSEILKYGGVLALPAKCLVDSSRVVCVSCGIEALFRESALGAGYRRAVGLAPGAAPKWIRTLASGAVQPSKEDGICRILTLARIHPRKGQRDMALALARLPVEVKGRVEYWLAGTGDAVYAREVERILEENGIRWRNYGAVSEVVAAELYAGCDFFAMSSRTAPGSVEGLGITYLEAGLFGKASVGYRTGGVGEAVLHGTTGLLVVEGDVEGLSRVIQALVENPPRRVSLGQAAREYALGFRWRDTAAALFRL